MRKLARHVKIPSRVRMRHVMLTVIAVGVLVSKLMPIGLFGYSKVHYAREAERRMLDEYELWSYHSCPSDALDFHGDGLDPWGRPYKIICAQERGRVTLAIVSLGPDDGARHDDLTAVQSFSP